MTLQEILSADWPSHYGFHAWKKLPRKYIDQLAVALLLTGQCERVTDKFVRENNYIVTRCWASDRVVLHWNYVKGKPVDIANIKDIALILDQAEML